jgi:tetratricopeptide (TPR) repeat protein
MNIIKNVRELLHQDRYDEAEELINSESGTQSLDILLAILYLLSNRDPIGSSILIDRAQKELQNLDVQSRVDFAFAKILQHEYEIAEEILCDIVQTDPYNISALHRLSILYISINRINLAKDSIDKILYQDSDNLKAKINNIRVLIRLDKRDDVLRVLEEFDDDILHNHLYLLDGYIEAQIYLNNEKKAYEVIDRLIQKDISTQITTKLYITKASMYLLKNRYQEAESLLKKRVDIDTKSISLIYTLAHILELRGAYKEVSTLYINLIKEYPTEPRYYLALALAQIESRQYSRAKKNLSRAESLIDSTKYPYLEANRVTLLAKLLQQSDTNRAKELYQEALSIETDYLPAMQGIGQILLLHGETKEAIDMFKYIESLYPMAGFSALASAKEFPKDRETLIDIEHRLTLQNAPTSTKPSIMYALASAWESNKEYKRAFEWAKKANELEKIHISYSQKEHTDKIAQIVARFSKEFVDSTKEYGNSSAKPTFVLGMPRSGTTLVEQMLGSHSRVYPAGELSEVNSLIHIIDKWQNRVGSEMVYPRALEELSRDIIEQKSAKHLKELEKLVKDANENIDTIDKIIDKLPHNFENIGLIKLLFPNAKIIHVSRTPEAIALSNYFTNFQAKHSGMGFAYDLEDIGAQIAEHDYIMEYWYNLYKDEILDIRYESLIQEPKKYAKIMLDYLELEWQDSVLEHTSLKREVKTASVWQVRQPLYQTSKDKWQHYIDELEPFSTKYNTHLHLLKSTTIVPMSIEPDSQSFNIALKAQKEGKSDEAKRGYMELLQKSPYHSGTKYLLATLEYQDSNFDRALELYTDVADEYASLPAYHYNIALVLYEIGSYSTAKISLKRAIKLNRDYTVAKELLQKIEER